MFSLWLWFGCFVADVCFVLCVVYGMLCVGCDGCWSVWWTRDCVWDAPLCVAMMIVVMVGLCWLRAADGKLLCMFLLW